jgi:23S rRNA pseudouridine1911/1915/1917 synthase
MMRLGDRLTRMFPDASRRSIKHWLDSGRVRVDGEVVRRGDVEIRPASRVALGEPPPPLLPLPLRLVHADDDIIVIDKPPGLLTISTESERERTAYRLVSSWARATRRDVRGRQPDRQPIFIVHRLDRETSGLLVFARTGAAKRALQEQFERRRVQRIYVAVVDGRVETDRGTLRDRLETDKSLRVRPTTHDGARPTKRRGESREAITHYRVVERRGESTVLELSLETGRRGQIRAQLAALGHPITGDARYGSRRNPARRVCLHATRLGFTHPRGGAVRYESPVPPPFRRA